MGEERERSERGVRGREGGREKHVSTIHMWATTRREERKGEEREE